MDPVSRGVQQPRDLSSPEQTTKSRFSIPKGFNRVIENIKIIFLAVINNIAGKGVNFKAKKNPLDGEYRSAAKEVRELLQNRSMSNESKAIAIFQITNRMLAKEAEIDPTVAQGGADLSREIVGKLAGKMHSVKSQLNAVINAVNEETLSTAIENSTLMDETKTAMMNDLIKQTGNSAGTLKRRRAQIQDLGPEDISPNVLSRLQELASKL